MDYKAFLIVISVSCWVISFIISMTFIESSSERRVQILIGLLTVATITGAFGVAIK